MQSTYWKPLWAQIQRESNLHPHCEIERANLFASHDGGSTEYEVLNWLRSSIHAMKPEYIFESGAYQGIGTLALASACRENGFGKVHSVEVEEEFVNRSRDILKTEGLSEWAVVHHADSLDFIDSNEIVFEIGFFDSILSIRPTECQLLLARKQLTKLAVFHDTSPYRSISAEHLTPAEHQEAYRLRLHAMVEHPRCTGFFDSKLSRGFMAMFFE